MVSSLILHSFLNGPFRNINPGFTKYTAIREVARSPKISIYMTLYPLENWNLLQHHCKHFKMSCVEIHSMLSLLSSSERTSVWLWHHSACSIYLSNWLPPSRITLMKFWRRKQPFAVKYWKCMFVYSCIWRSIHIMTTWVKYDVVMRFTKEGNI